MKCIPKNRSTVSVVLANRGPFVVLEDLDRALPYTAGALDTHIQCHVHTYIKGYPSFLHSNIL